MVKEGSGQPVLARPLRDSTKKVICHPPEAPTVIYVPALVYDTGFEVLVADGVTWAMAGDGGDQYIEVTVSQDFAEPTVFLSIIPKIDL